MMCRVSCLCLNVSGVKHSIITHIYVHSHRFVCYLVPVTLSSPSSLNTQKNKYVFFSPCISMWDLSVVTFSLPTKLLHSAGSDQLPLPTSLVTWENMWKPFSAFVCQEVDSTIKHTKISPAEICTARSLYRFTSTSFCAGIGPKLPILVCRPHRGKFESACLPVGLSQGSLLASFLYWIWEQLQCLSLNPWNHERYRQRERTCNLFFFCAVAYLTNSRAWWCVHLQQIFH